MVKILRVTLFALLAAMLSSFYISLAQAADDAPDKRKQVTHLAIQR